MLCLYLGHHFCFVVSTAVATLIVWILPAVWQINVPASSSWISSVVVFEYSCVYVSGAYLSEIMTCLIRFPDHIICQIKMELGKSRSDVLVWQFLAPCCYELNRFMGRSSLAVFVFVSLFASWIKTLFRRCLVLLQHCMWSLHIYNPDRAMSRTVMRRSTAVLLVNFSVYQVLSLSFCEEGLTAWHGL